MGGRLKREGDISIRIADLGLPWELSWCRVCLQCRRPWFDSCGKICHVTRDFHRLSPSWRRDRLPIPVFSGFPGGSDRIHLQCGRPGFDPWVWKIPWRRAWQPSPAFLPGESAWTEEPFGLQSMGLQTVRHT